MPLFQMTGGLGLKTYGSHVNGTYWSNLLTTFNLTPQGAQGSLGPIATSYPTGYPSVSVLNGVQRITFPFDCMIEADVMGANGMGYSYTSQGGRGRGMRINFKYQAGQYLMCLVGQGGHRTGNGGGGGGASHLWEGSVSAGASNANLLAIGGGGGGSGSWYMNGGDGCRYTYYSTNVTYGNYPKNYYGVSYNRTTASIPPNTYGGNHGPYTQEDNYGSWNAYWNGPASGGAGWNSNATNMRGKNIKDTLSQYYTYYPTGGGERSGFGIVGGVRYYTSGSTIYTGRAISSSYTDQGGFGGGAAGGGNGISGGGGGGYTGGNGGGNWQGGGTNGRYGHGAGFGGTSYIRTGSFNGVNITSSNTILGTNSGTRYGNAGTLAADGYITLRIYDIPAGGTKMLNWV